MISTNHTRPKCVRIALAILALAALLVPSPSRAEDPYDIYAIIPLTGSAAFFGKGIATAFALLEQTVNKTGGIRGRPIKIVVEDDQSSPQVAVQLTGEVVAKKVPVILGSALVATCSAMAPLTKDGPVVYCFSPAIHPPNGSFMFSSGISSIDQAAAAVQYVRARGWTKMAFISTTDATGQDADRSFTSAVTSAERVASEHFATSDISVNAQLAQIKASGAQVLFAWITGAPVATVLRGAVELGLDIPIITSTANMTYAQMSAYASFLPKELYFAGIPCLAPNQIPNGAMKHAIDTFINAFKETGQRPDLGETLPWDATLMIVDALRKYGTGATAAQIRDYIAGTRDREGILGRFDFGAVPQRGLDRSSIIIEKWDPALDTWYAVSRLGGTP